MHSLRFVFEQKAFYFIAFLAITASVAIPVMATGKIESFILLNSLHTKWLDQLFTGITWMGDGLFVLLVAACLFVTRFRQISLHIIIAYLCSGLAAQLLKRFIAAPRPRQIISSHAYSHFLDGITGAGWSSFPSGHTTSIFALATVLALYTSKKTAGVLLLLMAILVGYSRIYLGQHFLQDVLAGALLGTATGTLVVCFIQLPAKYFTRQPAGKPAGNMAYVSSLSGN